MNGYSFSGLDYWKLADELSVIDASFLTLGVDPGHYRLEDVGNPIESQIVQVANFEDDRFNRQQDDLGSVVIDASHFRAVFKAIRSAILSNKLRAKISNWARHPEYTFFGSDTVQISEGPNEDVRNYGFALSRGVPTLFSNADSIHSISSRSAEDRKLYILKEPDWTNTSVEVDELKRWYLYKGVTPGFFFPSGVAEGFRDKTHKRYSAKLATAVEAWEAVDRPAKNKSVKASLIDWVMGNGVRFGLGNDEGTVSPTAAEEVAKIANWQTGGGANRTYTEDDLTLDDVPKEIQNFTEVTEDSRGYSTGYDTPNKVDDDEVPF